MMHVECCIYDRFMQVMQNGFLDKAFIWIVTKNPPIEFLEMLVEAQKHITMEEIIGSRKPKHDG